LKFLVSGVHGALHLPVGLELFDFHVGNHPTGCARRA